MGEAEIIALGIPAIVAVMILGVTQLVKIGADKLWPKSGAVIQLMPYVPMLLAALWVWATGSASTADGITTGAGAGAFASWLYKAIKVGVTERK